ncbi:inactive hydroxysteroid dehydrogenase-like protein 1 [Pogona vitticeps]
MAAVDSFALLLRELGRSCTHSTEMLALLGAFYATKTCFAALRETCTLIRVHFLSRLVSGTDLVQRYGQWAVVTGCTSGVGKSYAKELAKRGVNVVLISRNKEKLEAVAREITESYPVETAIIVADFSQGREIYPAIERALKGKEIGILVNNVGVSYGHADCFTSLTQEKIWELIHVNIGAANMMVLMVLPGMMERKKGAVVNISSASCIQPSPQITAYSASKAYLDHFSRALHYECAPKGIFVQSLVPCFISTKMTEGMGVFSKESFLVPSADEYARHAVTTLGISRRTTGYWPHSIMLLFGRCLPECFWAWGCNRLVFYSHKKHL